MEGMMEPPPPGIVPNFPPDYPFKWQQKIMPEPHPNHLLSMGLPATFSSPRRSNPGYGGYQYCRGYDGQGRADYHNDRHGGYGGYNEEQYEQNVHENGYGNDCVNQSDEYTAYDDDEDWQGEGEWNEGGVQENDINCNHPHNGYDSNLAPIYSAPAPAPRSKNHYYNLAPKMLSDASGSTYNGLNYSAASPPPQRPKKQEPSEAKKQYLRKVFGDRYCEGCNYGFHSLEKYREHLESHVKCPFAGCGLETTIVRLDEHLTVAHLLNPSATKQIDTAEYLRQRKNHFPSVQRAQLKAALAEQQKKRGEVLALDQKWEKNNVGDKNAHNVGENNNTSIVTPPLEVDPSHVDSHEYESVKWTEPPNNNHAKNQDAFAKRKLQENNRQRAMVKRQKIASQHTREVMGVREVDVLSRIPAFCGIETYREDSLESIVACTLTENDISLSEPGGVLDISDDEDDIPIASHSSSPTKDKVFHEAQINPKHVNGYSTSQANAFGADELNVGTTVTPPVTGGALRLLMGDYGTDSEEEDLENTNAPASKECTTLPKDPTASVVQRTVLDVCDNSHSSTAVGDTSSSNTVSFEVDNVSGKEISSPGSPTKIKTASLGDCSESEEEIFDAKVLENGEGKRRRRGKRGKKKKKFQVVRSDVDLGDIHTIDKSSEMPEYSKCNEESIAKFASGGVSATNVGTKMVAPLIAPHLKPLNKKEVDSEDECEDIVPRERRPTTRWTEDKIFSYQLKGQYKRFKNNYKKSLLVKLLGDEVVRERNIILQCAKFIVQNDFFEQKLLSMPQPKRVLVEERTGGAEMKEVLRAGPDAGIVKETTPGQVQPDDEGVEENGLCQTELTNPHGAVNGS